MISNASLPTLEQVHAEIQRRQNTRSIEEDRELCRDSLTNYIRAVWHQVEPAKVYTHGWHIDAIADHLEAITKDQLNRLIINVPPGMMKSLEVNVFWHTWEWGPANLPHIRTVATSYKESLAKRDNIKARRLIMSQWFQERWGHQFDLMSDQNATIKFENSRTGFRMATPFNSVTGERGHRVNLDDPLSVAMARSDADRKHAEETFLEAVPNRMVDPELSAICIIMQRLHAGDTTGIALAKNLGYQHLMLPMEYEPERRSYTIVKPTHFDAGPPIIARYDGEKQIWYEEGAEVPENRQEYVDRADVQIVYPQDQRIKEDELLFEGRFPRHVVDRDKKPLGNSAAGQNQQRPAPKAGNLFSREDFNPIREAPAGTKWIRAWDLAASEEDTSARTAGVKMGKTPDGRFVVGHLTMGHLKWNVVRKRIKQTAALDSRSCRISLPQDPGQAGKAQAKSMVSMLAGYNVEATTESGDKVTRAEPFASQVEAGNVDIVIGAWNEDYFDEITTFPSGKFKDVTDASSRAFNAHFKFRGVNVKELKGLS